MKKLFILTIVLFSLVLIGSVYADSTATANTNSAAQSGAVIDQSGQNNSIKNYNRALPYPGVTPLPQTNGFFTAPTPDSSFRSIVDILAIFGDANEVSFSKGALENMAKGGDVESHLQIVRGNDAVPRIVTKEDSAAALTIGYDKPVYGVNDKGERIIIKVIKVEGVKVTGWVDGEAKDADTNSIQVIGKAGLKVLADGNNYMVVKNEGAHRKVEADGYGIGFYTVGAQVSDGGQTSGLIGGGFGYASNEAGPEDRPWFQGYCGVK